MVWAAPLVGTAPTTYADVAELADAPASSTGVPRGREGSSPSVGTAGRQTSVTLTV